MQMRFAALMLLGCAHLSGQPAAQEVRELALTSAGDAGTTTFHLRNEYRSPATAWIVACQGSSSQWHWSDEELGLEGKPIEPGKETEFRIPSRPQMMRTQRHAEDESPCTNFQVVAAVFGDGTVSGDLRWINAIVTERRKAYQDLAKVKDMLNKAVADGTTESELVRQLAEWQNSEMPRGMTSRPAANYGRTYGWGGLMTAPPARPFPRAAVPGATLWLVKEKKKTLPEAIKLLAEWRDRLGQLKPVTEAGGAASPQEPISLRAPFSLRGREPLPEMVGKAALDFTLKDVDGHEVALKDLRGKTVLLDFWATWCEPCRADVPEIKALYEEFKDRGLVVVCIDFSESAETARKYFDQEKLAFTNLLDPAKETFKKYGEGGIPKVVLIDKDGIVRYFQEGRSSAQDFRAEVKKLGL